MPRKTDCPECHGTKSHDTSRRDESCPLAWERLLEHHRKWKREKRATDPLFCQREQEYHRDLYANDPEYRERQIVRSDVRYWNLSGIEYNLMRLKDRRAKALKRMAIRNARED